MTASLCTIPLVLINDINFAGICSSMLCYWPLLWTAAGRRGRDENRENEVEE